MKNKGLLIGTVILAVLCLAVVNIFPNGKKTTGENENTIVTDQKMNEAKIKETAESDFITIANDAALEIPIDEVTEKAAFYPIEVDGTKMEVLAVKDSEGTVRTAFNTCQICYGSGRGYYEQNGNVLVCQNCGNQFTVDQVEIESGGCNPWPIFDENKTIEDNTIMISYDFLSKSKEIFASWKQSY